MIRPGEIYFAEFGEAGPHPIIVVSREELNRGTYVVVVVCTSARFATRCRMPNCVPFYAGQFSFTFDCVAQCESIIAILKTLINFTVGKIGVLNAAALRDVLKAVGYVIECDCDQI